MPPAGSSDVEREGAGHGQGAFTPARAKHCLGHELTETIAAKPNVNPTQLGALLEAFELRRGISFPACSRKLTVWQAERTKGATRLVLNRRARACDVSAA